MSLAASYSRALFELVQKNGERAEYIGNLKQALARRGHEKLLPDILSHYELLALKKERLSAHREVTPERERTRQLLELYKKLIASTTHE
ncbi:MAG TPA: hypothetical protein VN701_00170 [Candidatus Paceibacterota bacterium]|nr:hypothetical protein [Candidatus Paceibacterota bacterium]